MNDIGKVIIGYLLIPIAIIKSFAMAFVGFGVLVYDLVMGEYD